PAARTHSARTGTAKAGNKNTRPKPVYRHALDQAVAMSHSIGRRLAQSGQGTVNALAGNGGWVRTRRGIQAERRAVEVTGNRQVRLVARQSRDPLPGEVRIRVDACGVCHSDVSAVEGLRAAPSAPIVPGHEIAGSIDAVGAGVTEWKPGDRA